MRDILAQILDSYQEARTKDRRTRDHPVLQRFGRLQEELVATLGARSETLSIKWSAGMGEWAKVPWVAFFDPREAPTIQSGVYCAYLFREDMTGLYLALTQGVSKLRECNPYMNARAILAEKAGVLRQRAVALTKSGFLTRPIDLRSRGPLGGDYESGTVLHKFYAATALPPEDELRSDLETILTWYQSYVAGDEAR